jgi:hypothetical protein
MDYPSERSSVFINQPCERSVRLKRPHKHALAISDSAPRLPIEDKHANEVVYRYNYPDRAHEAAPAGAREHRRAAQSHCAKTVFPGGRRPRIGASSFQPPSIPIELAPGPASGPRASRAKSRSFWLRRGLRRRRSLGRTTFRSRVGAGFWMTGSTSFGWMAPFDWFSSLLRFWLGAVDLASGAVSFGARRGVWAKAAPDGIGNAGLLRQILSDRQNLRYTSGFVERTPPCPRQPQSPFRS